VRPRAESRVQAGLANARLETFVPWYKVRRRWSDRVKTVAQNLFPGYVFCRSTFAERLLVMNQPGVQWVVSFGRGPALIPNQEISSLRRALESGLRLGPWPHLEAGQRVRIDEGALAGTEGRLVRDSRSWRVVISVDALRRSIAVEVDRDMVRVMNDSVNAEAEAIAR
jgi:transcription antitermination factor NusG